MKRRGPDIIANVSERSRAAAAKRWNKPGAHAAHSDKLKLAWKLAKEAQQLAQKAKQKEMA
jgi:hypothetical protein